LTYESGKWRSCNLDDLSFFQMKIEANIAVLVGGLDEILSHAFRNRLRSTAIHEQAINSEGPVGKCLGPASGDISGRRNQRLSQHNPYGSSHNIKQHSYSAVVV
jgi:hypothetical protein